MLRSLHMKLVMLMVLLILSLRLCGGVLCALKLLCRCFAHCDQHPVPLLPELL